MIPNRGRAPGIDDAWFLETLLQDVGEGFQAAQAGGTGSPLRDLEEYESILYSLEKQDLVLIVKLIQTLSTATGPKGGLYTLVKELTEVLDVSHCSMILINLDRNEGTVVISHEDPGFQGVRISLERYPEILRSLKTGEITIVKNPTKDPLMYSLKKEQMHKIRDVSIMVLPLAFQGRVFGTLLVRKQRHEEGFFIREVRICQLMAHVALRFLQRWCQATALQAPARPGSMAPEAGGGALRDGNDLVLDSTLLSCVPVAVLVLDSDGRIRRANPQAAELLGLAPEELLAMPFTRIVPDTWIEEIREKRRETGAQEAVDRYHVSYLAPGGAEKVLSVVHEPVHGGAGFSCVFIRDVSKEKEMEQRLRNQKEQLEETNLRLRETRTELLGRCEDLRRTNERLEELNKIKTHFLAVATHEIRTPLSVIIGYGNFLLQERAGAVSVRQKKILEESVESGERLLGIVNEMLDFSRIETGNLQLRMKDGDLCLLLERVHRQMRIMAERAKIDLRLELPGGPVVVTHDPDRIEQVLVNLISNSIKFTDEGGHIVLCLGRPEAPGEEVSVEVSVADDGRGVSASRMERIFADGEPFVTSPLAPPHMKGVGLGLAISRRIIEAHRGRIWAESREGEGATFHFRIPCRQREQGDRAPGDEVA